MTGRWEIIKLPFQYIGLWNGYGLVALRAPAFYGSYVEGDGVQAHRESEFVGCAFLEDAGRQVHCLFNIGSGVGGGACLGHYIILDFYLYVTRCGCSCGIIHREQEQVFVGGK